MAELSIEYEPREQFVPFHNRSNRFSKIVAHRRAGKTVACIADVVTRATYTAKKNARYGYIAPFQRQAREIAWTYLKDMTAEIAIKVKESTLTIELFNGALIQLFGADNPDNLRGLYFDGVILDEFGDMKPSLWEEVVLPTLIDREGWAVFIGTPKGKNHFYDVHVRAENDPDWYGDVLKASQTKIIPAGDLKELQSLMDEEQYAREFECSFDAAVSGTYYAKHIQALEAEGRIFSELAVHDSSLPVMVSSDLGYTDSSSYWFWQERPDGYAIIDYYENHGEPLDHYFGMLTDKGYNYERIYLPHDARAKSLQTGRSTIEQFVDYFGQDKVEIVDKQKIQHGIDAVRLILPDCFFSSRTEEGVECLREYRRTYDETTKVFRDTPLHNWASHGSDAFRYLALVIKKRIILRQKASTPKTGYGLEELFQYRESKTDNRRDV